MRPQIAIDEQPSDGDFDRSKAQGSDQAMRLAPKAYKFLMQGALGMGITARRSPLIVIESGQRITSYRLTARTHPHSLPLRFMTRGCCAGTTTSTMVIHPPE